jgi:hypothetical protein
MVRFCAKDGFAVATRVDFAVAAVVVRQFGTVSGGPLAAVGEVGGRGAASGCLCPTDGTVGWQVGVVGDALLGPARHDPFARSVPLQRCAHLQVTSHARPSMTTRPDQLPGVLPAGLPRWKTPPAIRFPSLRPHLALTVTPCRKRGVWMPWVSRA